MVKRKSEAVDETGDGPKTRRSSRHKSSNNDSNLPTKSTTKPDQKLPKTEKLAEKPSVAKDPKKPAKIEEHPRVVEIPKPSSNGIKGEQQYWLMKAEPESRLEKGHDIKFSVDDLASKTEPEPWDGIRNPVGSFAFICSNPYLQALHMPEDLTPLTARNNLRAMKKNDLAFFYHSSCKIPAIVGIMEVVKEHTPDLSAQDPKAPYYDAKDVDPAKPKWSVVHVEFRSKLKEPITLKELREFGQKGGPLEGMQMLKQSRLSVSKVNKEEWDFLLGVVDERGGKE